MLKRKMTNPNPLPSERQHPDLQPFWRLQPEAPHRCLAGSQVWMRSLERKHRSHRLSMRPLRPWLPWCFLLRFHHPSLPFLIGKTIKCKHALHILFTDWVWPKSRRNFIFFQFSNFLYGSLSFNSPGDRKMLPITFINWMKRHCGTLIPFPFAWSVPYFPGCKLQSQMFL